jgi:hypothetical protein
MSFPPSASFVPEGDRASGALYGLAIGDALGKIIDGRGLGLAGLTDSLLALRR